VTISIRRLLLPLAFLAALAAPAALGADETRVDDTQSSLYFEMPERIVVVSTVLGHHEEFEELLRRIGLIDENTDWIGGETHLVQLGNMFGRGPQLTEGIELLMKLEKQAEAAGGRVHALHGRTENMILRGDLSRLERQPEQPLYVKYAGPFAEENYEKYVDEMVERYQKDMRAAGEPEDIIIPHLHRNYVERQSAVGGPEFLATLEPGTEMGDWLHSRPALVRIGDFLFSFGGVHEKFAEMSLEEINDIALRNLRNGVVLQPRLVDKETPVWWSELAQQRALDKVRRSSWVLWKRDARAMVVGLGNHPYRPGIEGRVVHVNSRFDLSDTHPAIAVEIVDGGGRLFFLDKGEEKTLTRIPAKRRMGEDAPTPPLSIRERQRPEIPPFDGGSGQN